MIEGAGAEIWEELTGGPMEGFDGKDKHGRRMAVLEIGGWEGYL